MELHTGIFIAASGHVLRGKKSISGSRKFLSWPSGYRLVITATGEVKTKRIKSSRLTWATEQV